MPPPTVNVISIVVADLLSWKDFLIGKQAEVGFLVEEKFLHL
jgi:hypothetical protein